jgi:hypothetical protein
VARRSGRRKARSIAAGAIQASQICANIRVQAVLKHAVQENALLGETTAQKDAAPVRRGD